MSCTSPSVAPVGPSDSIARHSAIPRGRDDEEALTADLVALAEQYGRYGYRKISALLKAAGWLVKRQASRADLAT